MKIISLKRNAGDAIGYDKDKEGYEITYRKDSESKISNVSIGLESYHGTKITEAALKLSRGTGTQEELQEVLVEAIEENTAVIMEKVLDEVTSESNSEAISSRISLVDGAELRIGDNVISGALASQIMAMVKARRNDKNSVTTEDWLSLINFTELLYDNVDSYVRDQLYGWLTYQVKNGRLTLTPEGKFLGYKGCVMSGDNIVSIHAGPGIIDGVPMSGRLPNNPGTVIEMARDAVDNDPNSACSTGLHVGSFDYAKSFSQGVIVLVEVDPRDVVSVPTDSNNQKIRACKYKVIKEVVDELTEFSMDFNEKPTPVVAEEKSPEEIKAILAEIKDERELVSFFKACLRKGEKIAKLVYVGILGDESVHRDVEVLQVKSDRILARIDGIYWRTFRFAGVSSVSKEQFKTLTTDAPPAISPKVKSIADTISPGDVISYLEYTTVNGTPRVYKEEMLVETTSPKSITVSMNDDSIRSFKLSGINKVEL